jgi:hypothetical protein
LGTGCGTGKASVPERLLLQVVAVQTNVYEENGEAAEPFRLADHMC